MHPFDILTSAQLEAQRAELLAQRIHTCGHARRARIQREIDAIDDELHTRAEQKRGTYRR